MERETFLLYTKKKNQKIDKLTDNNSEFFFFFSWASPVNPLNMFARCEPSAFDF